VAVTEQVVLASGWLMNLVTAILVAWFTAWFYSRQERHRLGEVWRQERLRASLDSLKESVHRLAQGVNVQRSLTQGKDSVEEHLFDASVEGYLDAVRGSASAWVLATAIGDPQLVETSQNLDAVARKAIQGEPEALSQVMEHSGAMLRRCDELLEKTIAPKRSHWWRRN
jgi:hypothetical protein